MRGYDAFTQLMKTADQVPNEGGAEAAWFAAHDLDVDAVIRWCTEQSQEDVVAIVSGKGHLNLGLPDAPREVILQAMFAMSYHVGLLMGLRLSDPARAALTICGEAYPTMDGDVLVVAADGFERPIAEFVAESLGNA